MTATPPDPEPQETPGLERGGSVPPGETPPESGNTSGLAHREPRPGKSVPVATLVLIALAVFAVAGIIAAIGLGMLRLV